MSLMELVAVAPEFPNESAFFLRFCCNVGELLDEEGRRLHEVDFRDEIGADEYVPCRFLDTRNGYLINETAFRQMGTHWNSSLEIAGFFSKLVSTNTTPPTGGLLQRAWTASTYAMFLPMYLSLRKSSHLFRQRLPVKYSSFFKVNLDLPTTLDLVFFSDSDVASCKKLDAVDFGRYISSFADEQKVLLNGNYACAGPKKLISEFVTAICTPNVGEATFQNSLETN